MQHANVFLTVFGTLTYYVSDTGLCCVLSMLSFDTIMIFLVSVPMGTYTMVTNIVFVAGRRELSLVVKVQ